MGSLKGIREREKVGREEREGERVCVCVCVREREREAVYTRPNPIRNWIKLILLGVNRLNQLQSILILIQINH